MVEGTKLEPREKITSRTLQNDNIFLLYKDSPHQVSDVAQQKVCGIVVTGKECGVSDLVTRKENGLQKW